MRATIFGIFFAALFGAFQLAGAGPIKDAANASEPTYLRCTYAEPHPLYEARYVILTIGSGQIRFDDHGKTFTNTEIYALQEMDAGAEIKGVRITNRGNEAQVVIDRVSGRTTLRWEFSRDADKLWNEKRQRIGGFDLKPGEKLWLAVYLNCKSTEPVF